METQKRRTTTANLCLGGERERRLTAEKDAKTAQDSLAEQKALVTECVKWGDERVVEIRHLHAISDEWKDRFEVSQSQVARLRIQSADHQAKVRKWQKQSEEHKTKALHWGKKSQSWYDQFDGLKRKLRGVTEDVVGPVKKASKRRRSRKKWNEHRLVCLVRREHLTGTKIMNEGDDLMVSAAMDHVYSH